MVTTTNKAAAFRAARELAAAQRDRHAANRFLAHAKMFEAGAVARAEAGDLGDGNVQTLAEAEAWDRMEEVRITRETIRTHHSIVAEATRAFTVAADNARGIEGDDCPTEFHCLNPACRCQQG